MKRFFIIILSASLVWSCTKDDDVPTATSFQSSPTRTYSGDFLQEYFFLTCDISQTTDGFLPTQVARAYGYVGVTAYQSVVHGISSEYSLEGQLQGFGEGTLPDPVADKEYNWALACNAATAEMMRRMFEINITPANLNLIDEMEQSNFDVLSAGVDDAVVDRSVSYGEDLAAVIYEISMTDGGHQSYLDPFSLQNPYEMAPDDYCWVPTGSMLYPLSPYWGENRAFVPGVVAESQPGDHVPFSTEPGSEFYQQAFDTYEQVTQLNTDEEVEIAKYWADDPFQTCTPAGHTFSIMTQLLQESGASLEKTAVGLGMMAVAENDAFISCWKSKFDYLLIRPVSYIQQYIDPGFETVIGTPSFPAFTSGHSAEIGAGIKVMIHLFADSDGNYTFTDLSQTQYGFAAREYNNFYDMAEECALSRYYGGIHYEMDNSMGLDLGFAVGEAVVYDINWPQNIQ